MPMRITTSPSLLGTRPGATREAAAYHEAAHAIVAILLPAARCVSYVAIARSADGWIGAMEFESDIAEWHDYSAEGLEAEALVKAAGRYGHELLLGPDLPNGADSWSVGDDGWLAEAVHHAIDDRLINQAIENDASEEELLGTQLANDRRRARWIESKNEAAKSLATEHWGMIRRLAEALIATEQTDILVRNQSTREKRKARGHRLEKSQIATVLDAHQATI